MVRFCKKNSELFEIFSFFSFLMLALIFSKVLDEQEQERTEPNSDNISQDEICQGYLQG